MNRCDRCNAEAYVETSGPGGFLSWCAHHWRLVELALTAAGHVVVRDTREELLVKP